MFGKGNKVYVIGSTSGHYKIGYSSEPKRRLKELQKTQGPYQYSLVYYWVVSGEKEARHIERYLHKSLAYCRGSGEWFELSPTDLIDLGNNLIDMAKMDYSSIA